MKYYIQGYYYMGWGTQKTHSNFKKACQCCENLHKKDKVKTRVVVKTENGYVRVYPPQKDKFGNEIIFNTRKI